MSTDATRVEAFAEHLAALKREGAAVLVRADPRAEDAACHRLLGEPGLDRRHVLVSTASTERTLSRYEPRETESHRLGVVDASGGRYTRSAAAAAPTASDMQTGAEATPSWQTTVDGPTEFSAILDAVDDHVERLFPATDAIGPGELRVCLDNLDALLDAVDGDEATEEDVFTFLHVLTNRVRERGGLVHVHVSAGIADSLVARYEPLFDATVDAETGPGGRVRQKWRLLDVGLESAWLTLD